MGNIKQINIKNHTYYFFNDMANIKNFNSDFLKIEKKLYKNIDICYIGYIITRYFDDEDVDSVNPFDLIFHEVDRYIEESIGNKYLIFASTDKAKKYYKIQKNLG